MAEHDLASTVAETSTNGEASAAAAVRALRFAVVAQWVFAAASVLLFELEAPRLPTELQAYAVDEATTAGSSGDFITGLFAAFWLLASLTASAGVWVLARWARLPYLATGLLGCLLMGALEPAVTSPWSTAAETLVHLLVGLAIGLLFWSPAAAEFARRPG